MSANPDGMIAIDSTQILILHDYAVNIRQMLDVIQKIDIEPELDYSLEVIPIKYSKVTDLYGTMNALISGGGAATGAGMAGGVNGGSMGMGGMGIGGMGMGGMGMGGMEAWAWEAWADPPWEALADPPWEVWVDPPCMEAVTDPFKAQHP